MSTMEFYILIGLVSIILVLVCVATYSLGYHRGQRSMMEPEDSTPEQFRSAEDGQFSSTEETYPDFLSFEYVTTGPIVVIPQLPEKSLTQEEVDELQDARLYIDRLTIQVMEQQFLIEAKEKLRQRYLHLLKAERAMMLQVIQGRGVELSSYWRRWVRDNFTNETPFWLSQSWSRIANIGRSSDSMNDAFSRLNSR